MNTIFRSLVGTAISLTLVASALAAGSAKPTTQNRSEIAPEFRWDFSPIYASWAAWEAGMQDIDGRIDAFVKLKGTLKNGPDAVLKAYQAFDDIGKLQ